VYKNNTYQFLPLECNLKDFLTSSFVYTLYGVHEDTTYILKYQERMKNFYPTSNLQMCSSFPSTIASFVVAIFNEGLNWALNLLKDLQIVTLASDSKKTLLLVSKTISTKESWILKLKESPAIAIGDSYTDYDFIKHCEVQVAMKNGETELKGVCEFQTEKSNQENGALDFILNFLKHQQA
ncbi:MAG: HAD hydrolase family protein, partial [Anaeroplasmataceae bacterium]|nr:HAD hydrolase family protein [Anaeroplasmataceae bacterium]